MSDVQLVGEKPLYIFRGDFSGKWYAAGSYEELPGGDFMAKRKEDITDQIEGIRIAAIVEQAERFGLLWSVLERPDFESMEYGDLVRDAGLYGIVGDPDPSWSKEQMIAAIDAGTHWPAVIWDRSDEREGDSE